VRQTLYLPNVLNLVPAIQSREKNDKRTNRAIRDTSWVDTSWWLGL